MTGVCTSITTLDFKITFIKFNEEILGKNNRLIRTKKRKGRRPGSRNSELKHIPEGRRKLVLLFGQYRA